MGRAKIEIKKIEDESNRQVTYSKRRIGLLKKAYELSILSDIDLALIAFSRSGRLTHFCSRKRVEDVLIRYLDCMDEDNEQCQIRNKESLVRTLERVRREDDAFVELINPETDACVVENLREVNKLKEQLSIVENQLRAFEADQLNFNSVQELKARELLLANTLKCVAQRKTHLQKNCLSSCDPSSFFEGVPILAQSEMIGFSNDANGHQQNYAQPPGENTQLMYDQHQLVLGSSSRTHDESQQHNEDYQSI